MPLLCSRSLRNRLAQDCSPRDEETQETQAGYAVGQLPHLTPRHVPALDQETTQCPSHSRSTASVAVRAVSPNATRKPTSIWFRPIFDDYGRQGGFPWSSWMPTGTLVAWPPEEMQPATWCALLCRGILVRRLPVGSIGTDLDSVVLSSQDRLLVSTHDTLSASRHSTHDVPRSHANAKRRENLSLAPTYAYFVCS